MTDRRPPRIGTCQGPNLKTSIDDQLVYSIILANHIQDSYLVWLSCVSMDA